MLTIGLNNDNIHLTYRISMYIIKANIFIERNNEINWGGENEKFKDL